MNSYIQLMDNNNIGAHSSYKEQVTNCFILNAAECALTDGNGVFQAQGLLAFLDDAETSYDDSACDKKAIQQATGNSTASITERYDRRTEQQLKVSPNPTRQRQLRVDLPHTEKAARLLLITVQGKTLHEWSLSKEQQQISISIEYIPEGIYLLQWSDGEQNHSTKIVLQ